jgi:hypothetical protein
MAIFFTFLLLSWPVKSFLAHKRLPVTDRALCRPNCLQCPLSVGKKIILPSNKPMSLFLLSCSFSHCKWRQRLARLLVVGSRAGGYARLFCCKMGLFSFKYLGVPLHYSKLRREDIQPIVNKVISRILGWKGRLLSYGARLTLLKAYLASIPIYLMSMIKFPKWAIEAVNSQMTIFLE